MSRRWGLPLLLLVPYRLQSSPSLLLPLQELPRGRRRGEGGSGGGGETPWYNHELNYFKKLITKSISNFFRALLHGTRDDSNGRHLPEHSVPEHKFQVGCY